MPDRPGLTAAFAAMAISAGLTSAIINPLDPDVRRSILAADVLLGRDEHAVRWIRLARSMPVPAEAAGAPASPAAPPAQPRPRPRPRPAAG
jgi:5-methyltetrahydrofolate--homocysteine methyltransferase